VVKSAVLMAPILPSVQKETKVQNESIKQALLQGVYKGKVDSISIAV
jgi:hypothetical protein